MSKNGVGEKGKTRRGIVHDSKPTEADSSNYLDFEVEIGQGQGREYPLAVLWSPAGEARETMAFPFDQLALESRLKSLEIALLRSGGSRRLTLTREEQAVQDFGRQLFSALFVGEARTRYDMSADIARHRGLGLRLKLRIEAPELARLPWEFLYDQRQGEYICMSRETPIVRYIELPQPIQPLAVEPPLQILGMISSPANLPRLDVEREKKRLETALGSLQAAGLVKLTWLEGSTWRDLQRAMRGGPWHVFHFIGHGGFDTNADEGVIAIENEEHAAHLLLATEMGRLLADHRSLRLAMLNACEGARGSEHDIFSSTAAILVRRGIPAVLAMQYAITDRAAIEFSRAFYEALADGLPVDASVCEARKAISLAITNTMEWGTPVLYMRTPQGTIFEMPASQKINHMPEPYIATQADKELQTKLDQLFTEGLAAYWVEDWDRACARFQTILEASSDYPGAAARLEESTRQRQLAALYARALDSQTSQNWSQAITALEELIKEAPEYKDASILLRAARKQSQAGSLYDEARRLFKAGQWQAVVRVLNQISSVDPNHADVDSLLPAAEKELAALKRRAELEAKYSQAVRAMDGAHWEEAQTLFKQIETEEPGYLETDKLLARVDGEISSSREQRQRKEQIDSLYEQAHGLLRARQWSKALARLDEIRSIDEHFMDVDNIAGNSRDELAREERETQRQTELSTLYAQAVRLLREARYQEALEKWNDIHVSDSKFPDRQKVQATARRKLHEQAKAKLVKGPVQKHGAAIFAGLVLLTLAITSSILQYGRQNTGGQVTAPSVTGVLSPTVASPALTQAIAPAPGNLTVPTSALPSDPTLYDDFEGPGIALDPGAWESGTNDPAAQATRQAGILKITTDGYGQYYWASARRIQSPLDPPMFIETQFKLDPNQNGGVDLTLNIGTQSLAQCQIWGDHGAQVIHCYANILGQHKEIVTSPIPQGTWHTARIEANPSTLTLTYYVDGLSVGNFTPDRAAELTGIVFRAGIGSGCMGSGCNNKAPRTLVGYFDYVRIGAIADDPTLYDNFNNAKYDGSFDTTRWSYDQHDPDGSAVQQNGVLVLTQGGINKAQSLRAIQYWPLKLTESMVVEANVEAEMTSDGGLVLKVGNDFVSAACGLHSMSDVVMAHCWSRSPTIFAVPVGHRTWHTVRIEINIENNVITFFMDGQKMTEDHYEQPLRGSAVYLDVSVSANQNRVSNTRPMVGYFDNVRVWPLK